MDRRCLTNLPTCLQPWRDWTRGGEVNSSAMRTGRPPTPDAEINPVMTAVRSCKHSRVTHFRPTRYRNHFRVSVNLPSICRRKRLRFWGMVTLRVPPGLLQPSDALVLEALCVHTIQWRAACVWSTSVDCCRGMAIVVAGRNALRPG
jgi:hypothetical protein